LAALGTELQSVKERLAETKKQHNAEADSLRKALSSVKDQKVELDSEVLALRLKLNTLQAKLKTQKSEDEAKAQQPRWKNRDNWRRLRKGMTKAQVKKTLGPPGKITADDFYGDIWYYPDATGGSVSFDEDSERVDGWEEP
jgi:chromosome segregation ATPase